MKITKNIYILSFLLLAFLSSNLFAQPRGGMQKFKEEKIEYFNEKLQLSDKEAKEFWPVYEDFHNRMYKIMEDERSLLSYYKDNSEAMSEKEVDESLQKYIDLQVKRTELGQSFHDKFLDILGKKKTMQMYALEREFRIYILDKLKKGHGGPGSGRGNRLPGPDPLIP